MTRRNPEQQLQIQVASFLRVALRPPTIWTAFPAGGGGKVRGAFLKAMGLQAGWPDLLVMHPFRVSTSLWQPIVLGIELKSAAGRPTVDQIAIQAAFKGCGAHHYVARSIDEVEGFLRGVGIPLFARTVEGGRATLIAPKEAA